MILEQFSLRPGSGGSGLYRGGDGVIRKLLFRRPVVLSVLSERRSTQPYGLHGNFIYSELNRFCHSCADTNGKMCFARSGGANGAAGLNLLHKTDNRVLNLGGKNSVSLQPGVRQPSVCYNEPHPWVSCHFCCSCLGKLGSRNKLDVFIASGDVSVSNTLIYGHWLPQIVFLCIHRLPPQVYQSG